MAGVTAMKPVTGVSAGVCRPCRARGPIVPFLQLLWLLLEALRPNGPASVLKKLANCHV